MPQLRDNLGANLPLEIARRIDGLCDDFESALKGGAGVSFASYLSGADQRTRDALIRELALIALDWLRRAQVSDPRGELISANPQLRHELEKIASEADDAVTIAAGRHDLSGKASGLVVRCPYCRTAIDLVVDASLMEINCTHCGGAFSLVNDAERTIDATVLTRVAHFELVERLGMGEFGTVWKARDTMLDRTVALKIPRRDQLDPVTMEKFMREARAAAQLHHPNIVSTYEVGRDGDTLYIVNECIHGASLSELVADRRLGVRESVSMIAKVADALDHAHGAGVIHRDLKPSNILVDGEGEPHLTDFGLAKRNERELTITTEGAILGTPAFMSPEQARGEAHRVDGRSDVYSLGVILFQLLAGELPFRGSTRMLLHKVIHDDPPGPRTLDGRIPKDLDTVCLKCLEKEPSRRYNTAGDLASDLRRYLAGEPVVARRLGRIGRTWRWARRNRVVATLALATFATLLTASAVSTYFALRAADNAHRADQQASEVTDTLYDSLLHQIRLTRELRTPGYGETIRGLVADAQKLGSSRFDKDELRRELAQTMGDFVAYRPQIITPTEGEVTEIHLSGDAKQLFAGFHDGRLVIYDRVTGKASEEVVGNEGLVESIAISDGGDRLVSADEKGSVHVWRRADGRWEIERSISLGNDPYCVFLSKNGDRAAWLKGPSLDVWDVATGVKLRSLPTDPAWSMRNGAFDSTGRRLLAGYMNDGADRVGWALWEVDTGEKLHEVDVPALGGTYPNGLALSKSGDRMAIGFDEALLAHEMDDFERTSISGFDATKAVAFGPTYPYLAAVNIRGRITLWNAITHRQLAALQQPQTGASHEDLTFSDDGSHFAASNANSIYAWDLTRADEKTVMEGHQGGVPGAAFFRDGRVLATGGKDSQVRFWNPSNGESTGSIGLKKDGQALSFSVDGELLAVGCMGGTADPPLQLFDATTREILYELDPNIGAVHSLTWAEKQDESYLAGCGAGGVVLWKVSRDDSVRLEVVMRQQRDWCLSTVLNRQGSTLVWSENDWSLQAWDVDAARQLPLHAPPMFSGWHGVAFLPDGQSIIYVSKLGMAEVWNVVKDCHVDSLGKPGTFKAPHLALSPNGNWLAALTQPDTVTIWHLPSRKHVYSLRPESGTVWSLAWDASSEHLAVGQSDGGLAVWHLPKIQEKLAEFGLQWQEDQERSQP